MSLIKISKYQVMWIFVLYDLPTGTKKERRIAAKFRKQIMQNGFNMFQFSAYIRHCASRENAQVHVKRVKSLLPAKGVIGIFSLTDKQFADIEIFIGSEAKAPPETSFQLELF